MCGIAGFWGAPDAALLATMTARIAHRGPDGEGFFEHPLASLGHRRLAIIDPAGGHQPVGTDDGLVQLTYNGEVYNFRELRAELEPLGHTFHTTCDTEVVLHAYLEWGTDCFARFNGMWALAILDLRDDARPAALVLARDHYGIKPLYYARRRRAGCCSRRRSRRSSPTPSSSPSPTASGSTTTCCTACTTTSRRPRSRASGRSPRPRGRWSTPTACTSRPTGRRTLVDRRRARPRRVPRALRAVGGAPARRRRPRRHLPVGRHRLVVDRAGHGGPVLREHVPDAVSLGDRLKTFSIVYDGDPIDEREYMDAVLAEVDAEPAVRGADVGAVRRRDRPAWCGTRTSRSCRPGRTRSGA